MAETDARALHRALTNLVRAYRFRDRDRVCCHDISIAQSHAMERLAAEGALTVNELAAALFLEKSSASRLADGLVRKGYAERATDPEDRRRVRISLTQSGRALARKVEEDLTAHRGELLTGLPASERRAVIRAVERLAELATSGAGHPGP